MAPFCFYTIIWTLPEKRLKTLKKSIQIYKNKRFVWTSTKTAFPLWTGKLISYTKNAVLGSVLYT